jgi:CDP-diacylglycerol--glycerol-3-phosphate 3-phosphatidyltransferase
MEQISTTEVPAQGRRMLAAVPRSLLHGLLHSMNRLAKFLVHLRVGPNSLSVLGLLAGLGAGVLFALGYALTGALAIIVCGLFDILDGRVAVNSHKKSLYGAIFDSTLDRYAEFFICLGLAVYFRKSWALWILFFTFLGSTMVSYTRARAEGLGIVCRVGFMQRAERIILLVAGALVGVIFRVFDIAMIVVLIAIALFSNITAFQRIFYVRKIEIQRSQNKEV